MLRERTSSASHDATTETKAAAQMLSTPISPAQFGAVIKADLDRYAVIVKERKITAD